MYIADGGGSAPSPTGSGSQAFKVNPPAIPGARDAFREAADKIDLLVGRLKAMPTPPWAADPVSRSTAVRFDAGNGETGREAAIRALTKYGQELRNSGDALQAAYDHYVRVEGVNSDRWKGQGFPAEA